MLIISQDDHVFPFVVEVVIEVRRHILHIIDAPSQLSSLSKIVDSHKQSFPTSSASGVLVSIVVGSSITEALHCLWWWWGCVRITVDIGIRIDVRHSYKVLDETVSYQFWETYEDARRSGEGEDLLVARVDYSHSLAAAAVNSERRHTGL